MGGAAGAVTARVLLGGPRGRESPLSKGLWWGCGMGSGLRGQWGVWGCAVRSGDGSGMGLGGQVDLGLTWDGMGMEMGMEMGIGRGSG